MNWLNVDSHLQLWFTHTRIFDIIYLFYGFHNCESFGKWSNVFLTLNSQNTLLVVFYIKKAYFAKCTTCYDNHVDESIRPWRKDECNKNFCSSLSQKFNSCVIIHTGVFLKTWKNKDGKHVDGFFYCVETFLVGNWIVYIEQLIYW